jgi:uncharacterized membrane protein
MLILIVLLSEGQLSEKIIFLLSRREKYFRFLGFPSFIFISGIYLFWFLVCIGGLNYVRELCEQLTVTKM